MISGEFYEKGYCGLDLLTLLENHKFMEKEISLEKRYELLICFNKVIKEIRNEKLILFFILNFIFFKFKFFFGKYFLYVTINQKWMILISIHSTNQKMNGLHD